jgi:HK97 family phage portal protein
MGILARIFGTETRALPPSDPYWANFAMTHSVGAATADSVLSNLAVAARCISLRSEMLASVPLFLFRRTPDGGRERADDNALYGVLHDLANPIQTAFEFREFLIRCLDLTGNAYARIERNGRGQVTPLWPLLPFEIEVEQLPNGRLRYRVSPGRGSAYVVLMDDMLHVRGPTRNGIMGLSPIAIARGALSLALEQAHTASALSVNGLRPSGIISFAQQLSVEQKTRFYEGTKNAHAGAYNAGKLIVMDGGAKFEKTSFSPEDAQFLESRKLANEDVARIFGLPPTCVGITDKATYSNVEQEARALVQNALGPLAGRVEAAMQRCLLTDVGRRTLYIEHDLDGLLRGDVSSRFESYRIGREIGVYSSNDVRRFENEPPLGPVGDVYNQPANWRPKASPR